MTTDIKAFDYILALRGFNSSVSGTILISLSKIYLWYNQLLLSTYAYMAFFPLIWSVRLGTLFPWCIDVEEMELKKY
jgi:hypothetical protein